MRMGLHTGTPLLSGEGYVGADVHRAARIAAVAHGGQVVVSAATVALAGTEGLRDLGAHRLKDLSAPERLYQLGQEAFPPLRSLFRTNLPVPTTPFLGRERELSEVSALLYDGARLLTLTGAGGSGKTRLALQSAGAVSDAFPDGVYWVPLAPLRDPRLVLEAAAKSLDAEEVVGRIADKRVLLYFDNFEHLLDASADIAELVGACPNLKVLVTSREPLHLSGEQEYAVPPFVHQEGVGFFLARARAIDPSFEAHPAVAEICTRLDNLPLALELAAARVKALPPEQLLQRLEQRLPLLTGGARDCARAPAHARGDDRLVVRPPPSRGAACVPRARDLRRWLHDHRGRRGRGRGPRPAPVAARQEPRAANRGALLAARDDSRVRTRTASSGRRL